MQAIKEKLNDMGAMRKAKAEAKQEEKEEKELAKARVEVAHEVRLAREAEAAMDLHVNKAAAKAAEHDRKHPNPGGGTADPLSHARHPNSPSASPRYSTNTAFCSTDGGDPNDPYPFDAFDATTTGNVGTGYSGNRPGGPPTNLL